ncbi:MAG: hypothetical protein IJR50_03685 [Treponema sp.]|nr:hypothetical protein [Treponema sp.]
MNGSDSEFACMIVSVVASVCIIATMPLRKSHVLKRAGVCCMRVKRRSIKLPVATLACCCVVPFLTFRINFSMYVKIMLDGVGLLGAYMMSSLLATAACDGVYENGVIADGALILFSDIAHFKKPDEQSEMYGNHVLEIETNAHGKKRVLYADENERNAVIEKICAIDKVKNHT